MENNKVAIKVEDLDRLAEGFQESRGIADKLTLEQMIEMAKDKVGGRKSTLAQVADKTVTEITAKDLEGATMICDYLCSECFALKSVIIPDGVKSIGEEAFFRNSSLETLIIGRDVEGVSTNAFRLCESLKSLSFQKDSKLRYIQSNAFLGNKALEHIILPNSLETVAMSIFKNCTNLKTVRFGENLGTTALSSNTFEGCTSLTDIYVAKIEGNLVGAPWGAPNSPTIHWGVPLPSEEE